MREASTRTQPGDRTPAGVTSLALVSTGIFRQSARRRPSARPRCQKLGRRRTLEIGLARLIGLLGHLFLNSEALLVLTAGLLLEGRDLRKLQRTSLGRR